MPEKKNAAARKGGRAKGKKRSAPRLSRLRQPPDLSVEAWQTELRRQYGREQKFVMRNVGEHPLFSEFAVSNPESGTNYRVAIRSNRLGENFCSCADFMTNDLGNGQLSSSSDRTKKYGG